MTAVGSLDVRTLHAGYASGRLSPVEVVDAVYDRIEAADERVWIALVPRNAARAAALALMADHPDPADRPALYGIPFAVKDNIDVAGLPTTAAHPGRTEPARESAAAVEAVLAHGALLIGKTNLDQFATGLNGTRSPYGTPVNPFDPERIPGGSSSGSAVAVSAGLVSFALGTDTAGSGRVPAALTGAVGVKPSRGLVSARGILPACRSLDCASVFALTADDGARVLALMAGPDADDPRSRDLPVPAGAAGPAGLAGLRLAVAPPDDPAAAWDEPYRDCYTGFLDALTRAGAVLTPIDMAPFVAAGDLLYQGAWVAERHAAVTEHAAYAPGAIDPQVAAAIVDGPKVDGAQVFADQDRLARLQAQCAAALADVDALLTPTVTCSFTLAELAEDPQGRNSRLGRYTTFTNLLDHAAVAVPVAIAANGMPFGVTLSGPAGSDGALLRIAAAIEALCDLPLAATGHPRPIPVPPLPPAPAAGAAAEVLVTVVGAHLSGMPLHGDLIGLGARLESETTTRDCYRLYALDGTAPPKPGMVRVAEGGAAIAVEVYRMSAAALGALMTTIPAPLGIGRVELADGRLTHGFVCEPHALAAACDITGYGGWRSYLAR